MPLALAAAHRGRSSFEQAIRAIATLPGGADTLGSITGQILGRRIGATALPYSLVPPELLSSVRDLGRRFAWSLPMSG